MPENSSEGRLDERWNLDRFDLPTDDERTQLERYRARTVTFADRCEDFLAEVGGSGEQVEYHDANTMLNAWNAAWKELRDWHQIMNGDRAATAMERGDRNPVSRVLIEEHGAITELSNKLGGQT